MLLYCMMEYFQRPGKPQVITVKKDQILAMRMGDCRITGISRSPVFLVNNNYFVVVIFKCLRCIIIRAIIYHNNFIISHALRKYGIKCMPDQFFLVMYRDNYTEKRFMAHARIPLFCKKEGVFFYHPPARGEK